VARSPNGSSLSISPGLRSVPFYCQPIIDSKTAFASVCTFALRNGGFDKGRRLIRLPAIGLPPGMPASARCEPPRGFPCQIRRGYGPSGAELRPAPIFCFFALADRRWARPAWSPSGVPDEAAVLAARAARGAALKPYRKSAQTRIASRM